MSLKIESPIELENAVRTIVDNAAQNNVGGLVAIAILGAIKLDIHANMRAARDQVRRKDIVRATIVPPSLPPGRNGS